MSTDWDAIGVVVTAIGTVAIAIFTFTLWRTTRDTLEHVRREFLATFRPKLVVRQLTRYRAENSNDAPDGRISGTLANAGGSPAIIVESRILHQLRWRNELMHPIKDWGDVPLVPPGTVLQAGESLDLEIVDGSLVTALRWAQGSSTSDTREDFAVGYVVYADGLGVRRRMGFSRLYDRNTSRLLVVTDPDYEYQDS